MDLDRYKILANSEKEFWEVKKQKLLEEAVENGHLMSKYYEEHEIFGILYSSYCQKCPFEIQIEELGSTFHNVEVRYYLNFHNFREKCVK